MTCVHHLPHIFGISNHSFQVTNQTSLITFTHTSYYKSINRKIMNFPHEYSLKFEVWLPSLVDTSYVVTPLHNPCNSSIKGAYMSPYLLPSLIFFQGWWGQIWQNLFVTRHGGKLYMNSNIGQVERLKLKSPNGFVPLVAKTKQISLGFGWNLAT